MVDNFERVENQTSESSSSGNALIQEIYSSTVKLPDTRDLKTTANLPTLDLDHKSVGFTSGDGPGRVYDDSLNGKNPRTEPADLGNAHHAVELIQQGAFQNRDGSLTKAAAESIRSAVEKAGAFPNLFQTYEGRTREVQDYINRNVSAPISLRFDRDHQNAQTLTGARPFIEVGIGEQRQRIPLKK